MDRSGTKEPIPSVKVLKARSADNHLLSEQHNGAMGTAELAAVMTVIVLGAVILLGTVGLAWVMFRPLGIGSLVPLLPTMHFEWLLCGIGLPLGAVAVTRLTGFSAR